MATPRELPADVAAALDRVPEARARFAELPAERQAEWLSWIDRGEDRGPRIDEMIRRLLPGEEEVVERGGPPWERYWWLWLLLLLLLVAVGLLIWWLLSRGDDNQPVDAAVMAIVDRVELDHQAAGRPGAGPGIARLFQVAS